MSEDRIPVQARGEVGILINGEQKIIRFSLRAQAKIVETLELEAVEKVPELLRKLDSGILAHLIYCALIPGQAMSIEELMEANIPLQPAMLSIIRAVNLSQWGTPDGSPFDRSPSTDAEAMRADDGGVSLTH